ncbi:MULTISPECIES: DNA repair protein RecN [Thauera]|jgi:DNA repair protein RecN (Recombination protein N)|uniref:DNA repair protein RecN n=1 Tax=Thauera aminoaromatica TaxID=164330 RepID=C4ZKG2_THASP|nr:MULTISPECIES: DNA repair protein RecN [Thauera]MBL8462569.1 DNA repair protein RecN [Thauera sp.]ACK54479.1 DNA repair protein RecN [Thauera aminoaromatica]KIN89580.1 DNA repair protein RecN [Thauera sp. SWB20]HNV89441.1 DNA repair protein RecN [Thauera aminoaromatica]HPV60614.1 DNA repair protein RecN [Thauera aminoaromatica]
MLRRLTIRDFVIVDRLDLEFAAGFGALTGETGAGKSILLDALGLALGGRGEAAMVRSGRERADVAAEFDLPAGEGLAAWLVEQELPADEGMLILRRTIDMGGRSRAWINGVAATLAQLRAAGEWLADIHGQHAHHALLRTDAQRALLDAQAGAGALVAEVAARHREWQRLLRLQREAEADSASSARERELLAWQLRELEQVGFDIEEWAEINAEHARLAHAASLIEGAEAAVVALGEGELAVCSVLGRLDGRIAALADFDAGLADVRELISAAAIQADEALHALRRYRDRLDLDPGRLAELERRIAAVMEAARKYRVQPEELPALAQQWRERLDTLEATADPARLAAAAQAARAAFESVAAELTAARLPAARRLSEEIAAAMQDLAMAGGRFEVALTPCAPSAAGVEEVEFRVAANAGQPLRSLAKVASGGELSRIGLAIQVITSRDSAVPTLIFDEVDVGIGGRVAEIVGKLLARLGQDRQVLCVTHLPQVAACADWQWRIAKREQGGETLSEVAPLDDAARVEEVARMLGGVNITATTREHAAEMLGRR